MDNGHATRVVISVTSVVFYRINLVIFPLCAAYCIVYIDCGATYSSDVLFVLILVGLGIHCVSMYRIAMDYGVVTLLKWC